jgi:hypothetical protein
MSSWTLLQKQATGHPMPENEYFSLTSPFDFLTATYGMIKFHIIPQPMRAFLITELIS